MKAIFGLMRAALLAVTLVVPASAIADATPDAAVVRSEPALAERALLTAISTWLSANFALPSRSGQSHLILSGNGHSYDPASATITLPARWSGDSPVELSVLIHEMAHHLQYQTSQRFGCPQEREALPLAAQERWLRMSGLDLSSVFGITPDVLLLSTQCIP